MTPTAVESRHLWTVTISDGYCVYEYDLPAANGSVSIHDLYELVRRELRATPCEGRLVASRLTPTPCQ